MRSEKAENGLAKMQNRNPGAQGIYGQGKAD
jgi:hypothetical protein